MIDNPIVLASASPRRHEILDLAGIPHEVLPADDESSEPHLSPKEKALALARCKARNVAARCRNRIVLGADTIVVRDDIVLGKPKSDAEAVEMLLSLQGREHKVMTGVWVVHTDDNGNAVKENGFTDIATVKFLPFSRVDAENYVSTGESSDKAGSYAIQGKGMRFVESINGDFYTVMGLPGGRLIRFLDDFLSG